MLEVLVLVDDTLELLKVGTAVLRVGLGALKLCGCGSLCVLEHLDVLEGLRVLVAQLDGTYHGTLPVAVLGSHELNLVAALCINREGEPCLGIL